MSGSSWDMGHGRGTAEGRDMGSFRVGAGCHQCSGDGGSGTISKEVVSISVRGRRGARASSVRGAAGRGGDRGYREETQEAM